MNTCVDELAVRREHLDAAVRAVGDVDEAVVRHLDAVHRPAELRRARALGLESRRGTATAAGRHRPAAARRGRRVDRRVAERAPHPLERAGVGVEHDDAAVAVAVGDEHLVGLRVDEGVGRLVDALRVGVAPALVGPPICSRNFPLLVNFSSMSSRSLASATATSGCCRRSTRCPCGRRRCRVRCRASRSRSPGPPHALTNLPFSSNSSTGGAARAALRLGHRARPVQDPDVIAAVHGDAGHLPSTQLLGSFGHAASTSNTGICEAPPGPRRRRPRQRARPRPPPPRDEHV